MLPSRCSNSLAVCPRRFCPFGHDVDSLGCPTCACLRNVCGPEPLCTTSCPAGFQRTMMGCKTYLCKPVPSAQPRCLPEVCRHVCRPTAVPNLITPP
ncbi:hypothetical protein PoB_004901700 [Plakobranchus ocellatus]|uniref:Antistasin-like domain-containing protein n=1 Tax=Plakobranchus ocellatus TaxID=259542 RepID=A0AAV4BT53_9GAST|nr:hypothetical protein PoB_004901700 [Plakobranchus ocellatus]